MSWTPIFWVREDEIEKPEEIDAEVFRFVISGIPGYVICPGESSTHCREVHFELEEIAHWILNGELGECTKCHDWGEEVDRKDWE